MRTYKQVHIEKNILSEAKCNKCGQNCFIDIHGTIYGLSTTVSGGYESLHLEDITKYSFEICEECLVKMFDEFVIPPKID